MKKLLSLFFITIFAFGAATSSLQAKSTIANKNLNNATVSVDASTELANAALKAHGGDKFKDMKTLIIRGTADVSGSPTQTIPASFAFVFSGEKYRVDINNPFQPLKQIYNGEQTYSSIPNFSLPPLNRLGLPLLQRLGNEGFVVSNLPEKLKGKKGFRMTSPEGYYTDFFVDGKTGQIKGYESSYEVNGRTVTTSVDVAKSRTVEGIIVPEEYAQRFDLGSLTIYSNFKAKDILINSEVNDDVFKIPN